MTLKNYPQILHAPKKIHFSEHPPPLPKKNIEIQILIAQKMSLHTYENIWVPSPLGARGLLSFGKKAVRPSKLRKCDAV